MYRILINGIIGLVILVIIFFGYLTYTYTPNINASRLQPGDEQKLTFSTFAEYLKYTKDYISRSRVDLATPSYEHIIEVNSPYEFTPELSQCSYGRLKKHKKGILLIHGLYDSPYSFRNFADSLVDNCILVRTVLLKGHGTVPGDLINARLEHWQEQVKFAISTLLQDCDEVYIGGYSTGGALALDYAINNKEQIKGLLLFNPCLKIKTDFSIMAKILEDLIDYRYIHNDYNVAAYQSKTYKAAANIYHLSNDLQEKLTKLSVQTPVLIAQSEDDLTVDAEYNYDFYKALQYNKKNVLIWFSNANRQHNVTNKVLEIASSDPDNKHIKNFGHLGIYMTEHDQYYGYNGKYKWCDHYWYDKNKEFACLNSTKVTYSELEHEDVIYRRTTFNPKFNSLLSECINFINS